MARNDVRSPDAAQRAALAERCTTEEALHRVRDTVLGPGVRRDDEWSLQ
jgi:hypothetical protein